MKKWLVALVALVAVLSIRFTDPWIVEVIRLKALDTHQRSVPQETIQLDSDVPIAVVRIDNDDIDRNGQWPWPRDVLANEIIRLYEHGAGLVVLPMLFAEEDRFGGDPAFIDLLQNAPVIVGQVPAIRGKGVPVPRGVAIKDNSTTGKAWEDWLFRYGQAIGPTKEIGESAYGVGMMLTSEEADGVVRKLPLVVRVPTKEPTESAMIFPSIPTEIVRVLAGDISYQMKLGDAGVEAVRIPQFSTIQTDSNGSIYVDYKYKVQEFAFDNLPDFNGGIVILSLTASGLDNTIATPIGRTYDHDLIAASVYTIVNGINISRPWWSDLGELAIALALGLVMIAVVMRLNWYWGVGSIVVALGGIFYGARTAYLDKGLLLDWSFPVFAIFLTWSITAFLRFMEEFKQKQAIKKQFAGYCSPTVVRMLQENPSLIKDGMKREISICFSDLRGFTPLGESFGDDVKGLTTLMNGYMDAITQPVLDADGMVIKYIGDASMHVHNAPNDDPNHHHSAVRTGLNMLKAVEKFNEKITAEGRPPIGMGAGINSGLGYLGEMGSTSRHSYDVLGDAVSTAARIESKCKEYGCLLLVGENTYDATKDDFFYLKVDELAVKGKSVGIRIYTVLPGLTSINTFEKENEYKRAQALHNQMHEDYRNQKFKDAIAKCRKLKGEFDGQADKYYDMWIERCEYMQTQDLPKDWNGVFIATTK